MSRATRAGTRTTEDGNPASVGPKNDRLREIRSPAGRRGTVPVLVLQRVRSGGGRATAATAGRVLDHGNLRTDSRNHPREPPPRPDVLRADRVHRSAVL